MEYQQMTDAGRFVNTYQSGNLSEQFRQRWSMEHRVLVMNNDQNLLHVLRYALEEAGFLVDSTVSKSDAIQLGTHHEYEAIIMDDPMLSVELKSRGCIAPMLLTRGKINIEQLVQRIQAVAQFVLA
jgi:DNA-binding NtrC family response regulator